MNVRSSNSVTVNFSGDNHDQSREHQRFRLAGFRAAGQCGKLSAKEIHVKWDKISEVDASAMKATSDLVTQVQTKYALSADQALKDVSAWTNGRSF